MQKPDGVVRVVFVTVALGMGVNFTSLNKTIHYGAPSTIEDYFQESGHVGRSGEQGKSIVFWKPSDAPNYKDTSKPRHAELVAVRGYLENTEGCRRCQLLHYFAPELIGLLPPRDLVLCCDVCARPVTTSSNWTLKVNREKGYLHVTNLSSKNSLQTFQLNVPVIITAKVKEV